jgi:hypothetical protein
MTIYYICRADELADLNLYQNDDEKIACDIVISACIYDDLNMNLVAVEADSENGTYAQLKGAALYSMELTAVNLAAWKEEGEKIYGYLLGPDEGKSRLWVAFSLFLAEIEDYENIPKNSSCFNELGKDFSYEVFINFDENMSRKQTVFASIMEDLYLIEELKTVTN